MESRIKYTIIASVSKQNANPQWEDFKTLVSELVSASTGGCTTYNATGYWSPNGDETRTEYLGANQEDAHVLEVITTTDKREMIQYSYQLAKDRTGVSVEWVHLEIQEVKSDHFKI